MLSFQIHLFNFLAYLHFCVSAVWEALKNAHLISKHSCVFWIRFLSMMRPHKCATENIQTNGKLQIKTFADSGIYKMKREVMLKRGLLCTILCTKKKFKTVQ